MDATSLTELRAEAEQRLAPDAWAYYCGMAGDPTDTAAAALAAGKDSAAWAELDLLPRYLRGIDGVDTSVRIGDLTLPTPVVVAATAAHGLAHPDGECATAAGAAEAGALYILSTSSTRSAADVGAVTSAPWWAQLYLLDDRERSRRYLHEVKAAGAGAIVFTVDYGGRIGWSRFRSGSQQRLVTEAGNYPDLGWHGMTTSVAQSLTPDDIAWVAEAAGLPVWVKGLLNPLDVAAVIDAGAAGIVVSNHGRRQLDGVVSTARALPAMVEAVDKRVPVMVDGGIRSGTDVLRALALGADAVGIGRPALWGLAARGATGVTEVVRTLTDELAGAMANVGAATVDRIGPEILAGR